MELRGLRDQIAFKAKEFYWTTTRAMGLGRLHNRAYVAQLRERIATRVFGEPRAEMLRQAVPHVLEYVPDQKVIYDSLWSEYDAQHGQPSDPIRVLHFLYLVQMANDTAEGDYLELGTHRGLTGRLIFRLMQQDRTLYLLDTYEGFAKKDLDAESRIYGDEWRDGRFTPTTPEAVAAYVGGGKGLPNIKPIKGWFPDSFAGLEDRRWRFVHIDFDLYQPIRVALDRIWPQMVPGGVVLVHDYGCYGFPGAKLAVDEFAKMVGLRPVPMSDRWGSVCFIKPD